MKNNLKFVKDICFFIIILTFIIIIGVDNTSAYAKYSEFIGADVINEMGIKGDSLTACVIDTGIDYTHTNLGNCNSRTDFVNGNCGNKIITGYDVSGNNDTDPYPEYNIANESIMNLFENHGTSIAGLINSDHTKNPGIAPESNIIAIKRYNATGGDPDNKIADGINWCLEQDSINNYNLTVISISLGSANYHNSSICSSYNQIVQDAVDNAVNNYGIPVVVSSGNENVDNAISFPACLNNTISVGATNYRNNELWRKTNRGPNLDLLAPGENFFLLKKDDSYQYPESDIYCFLFGCSYGGTSLAAPIVSGSILLLKEYDSALKPKDILNLLSQTGDDISDGGNTYKVINLPKAFHIYDWYTYHHDNRRTGFTLLKGDVSSTSKRKGMNLVITGGITTDALARPSIADIDNDERQDVIVSFTKSACCTDGWIVGLEKSKYFRRTMERWNKDIRYPVTAAPSLGNIDGTSDKDLEVVVGLKNGTLMVIDPDGSKDPPIKWTYTVPEKYSAIHGDNIRGNLGFTAIADIDNDGKAEIIFSDYQIGLHDWKGELYVLEDDGATYTEEDTIYLTASGDGGAQGAPAIANLDSDDNQEIVIPGYYGIKVYDFDSGSLSLKCSNSHGKIIGAPVIYDVDGDNEYEIIYTTADYTCSQGGCSNKLYVINASSCTTEKTITLSIYSLVAPAVANLDSDSNLEIVVQGRTSSSGDYDKVEAYDANTGSQQWSYPTSGNIKMIDVAPNIADIDGDGDYNIILAKDSSKILILKNDGTLYDEFEVEGLIGSSPVIGDLSGKGVAELTVKRAGSPIAVITTLTGANYKPDLTQINNLTAIAGNLININESGELSATDPDGDSLAFYYSSPFNESGLWQSTINDTGNYSILIEASDGNLSDYKYVDLIVFNSTTKVTNTFDDSETEKSLSYTGVENQTVYVRILKNASVIYSKIKLEGSS